MLTFKSFCTILMAALIFSLGCELKTTTSSSKATTQPASKAASNDPIPDLPDYPGATRTAYITSSDSAQGFSKSVKAELATSDPFDKVIDFYKLDNLSQRGWKPTDVKTTSASAEESTVTIGLEKGTSIAKIDISQKAKENVVISLERKDK
ncbi:MAG: hypothetical protein ABR555_05180 [Pyrinomonadaceae bacterium]